MYVHNTYAYIHACPHAYVSVCVINRITRRLLQLWILRTSKINIQFTRRCVPYLARFSVHIFTTHTHKHTRQCVSVDATQPWKVFDFPLQFHTGPAPCQSHTHTTHGFMCIHKHTRTTLAQGNAKLLKQTAAVSKKFFTQNPIQLSSAEQSKQQQHWKAQGNVNYSMQQKLMCAVSVRRMQPMSVSVQCVRVCVVLCCCVCDLIEFISRILAKWRPSPVMQCNASLGHVKLLMSNTYKAFGLSNASHTHIYICIYINMDVAAVGSGAFEAHHQYSYCECP